MAHIRSMQPVTPSNSTPIASMTGKTAREPRSLNRISKPEATGMRLSRCQHASEIPTILQLGSLDLTETEA